MTDKWVCRECDEIVYSIEILRANHPFIGNEDILGCPYCGEAGTLVKACDFEGCNNVVSSGFPTEEGYKHSCYKHRKELGDE